MSRFPLRLVPWEEFFYYKHCPSHPVTFFAAFEFSQPLDPHAAEEAFRQVCRRQPLARAVVQAQGNRLFWIESAPPQFQWSDRPLTVDDLEHGDLDIQATPGLRIIAFAGDPLTAPRPRPATILAIIHHVAFDGLGVLQILLDWLQSYQAWQRTGHWDTQPDPTTTAMEESRLHARCRPARGWRDSLRLLPGQWKSLRASVHLLGRRAIALVDASSRETTDSRKPQVARLRFDPATTGALKQAAAARSASLNSLLLRELFAAIDDWQTAGAIPAPGTHLRIMVPINERQREHRDLPACNHCTMIHLDRTRAEVREPTAMLASIEQELRVIQRWKLSWNFWRGLAVLRWLPGGLRRFRGSATLATASLTNLGRLRLTSHLATDSVDPPGTTAPLRLLDCEIVAPLVEGTMAALAVSVVNSTLRITLQSDADHLTDAQAIDLLERYEQRILANLSEKSASAGVR